MGKGTPTSRTVEAGFARGLRRALGRAKRRVESRVYRTALKTPGLPGKVAANLAMRGITLDGRTMVSMRRLRSLYRLCTDPALPAGSFVECGVARGGCLALMSLAAGTRRSVWGFDSFEGMPPLTAEDKQDGAQWVGYRCSGPTGQAGAEETIRRYGDALAGVRLVAGWFEDTLPGHVDALAPISVLRLDNDWYRSTLFCLETLYDAVAPGGCVLIDDYHTFQGCRQAVDEFRQQRGIDAPLITVEEDSEAYWRKGH